VLAIPGVRAALINSPVPVIGVSPIIGGRAVKGPTAKIMRELGLPTTAAAVAGYYGELLDGFVLDRQDAANSDVIRTPTCATHIQMDTLEDRERLAREVLAFASKLKSAGSASVVKQQSSNDGAI